MSIYLIQGDHRAAILMHCTPLLAAPAQSTFPFSKVTTQYATRSSKLSLCARINFEIVDCAKGWMMLHDFIFYLPSWMGDGSICSFETSCVFRFVQGLCLKSLLTPFPKWKWIKRFQVFKDQHTTRTTTFFNEDSQHLHHMYHIQNRLVWTRLTLVPEVW